MHEPAVPESARLAAILTRSADLLRASIALTHAILAAVDTVEQAIRAGRTLFFCGNGGSAADAQHPATELLVRLRATHARPSWPAIALPLDSVTLTAAGNDFGFDQIFSRPLQGLGRPGDVLVALSTSGRSPNILHALTTARTLAIPTVGLLGNGGGPAAALCDIPLIVPSTETARIQEVHIALGHAMLELLEDRLMTPGSAP